MAKSKKSRAPSGLSITRKGSVFTFKWKKGESYKKGQKLEYKLGIGKGAKWKKLSIGSSASSKSISISLSGYYPNKTKKLGYIKFRVRGCGAKKSWSKWNTKTYDILIPRKAGSLSFSLSDTYSNVGTFSWKVATDSSERQMFTNIEYQSQLTTSGETNGKKLSWNSKKAGWLSGTGGSEGSHSITEDTAVIATGSHIRWFRIRARGVQGNSDWVYAKHVYALSRAAKINFAKAMPNDVGGISVLVDWTAPSDSRTPIDKTTVQWTISVPKEGLTCSDDASWTDAGVSKDTGGNDRAQFSIDRLVKEDSCLFVRVNNEHDGKITYGTPHTAIIEKLKAPTFTKLDVNMETKKVTITATNNSEVPDSKLAVLFRSSDNPNASILIGVMEHGENIATFDCPYLGEEEDNSFGIYAFQGNHSEYINEEQITEFKVSVNAKSDETWKGGEIPLLAKNVKVASLKEGSVQVTWNWTGDKNEGAIISWTDHIDAWESTDEPSTYTINRLYDGKWNIHGLETGRTWYIRVRLTTGSGENITAGPWSDILSIDLSSAPAIPTLVLSDNVVTESGSVSASWIYVSSDGSRQGYGEICEVEITSSGIRYGDIIAHTNSSQTVMLSPKDIGWKEGSTHFVAARVMSLSGKVSDDWSPAVSITVAEKFTAEIIETNLKDVEVIDDIEEGIKREVLSLTDLPLTAKVKGGGEGITSILAIERASDYHMDRPDESDMDGYMGETIAAVTKDGEGDMVIDQGSLVGALDDGGSYILILTVKDSLGQSAKKSLFFEVHWQHQAFMPSGTLSMDKDRLSASIVLDASDEKEEGDVCDIYRLSADKPELIVSGGVFGEIYIDPYPAFGEWGGYRIVCRTKNGDYITKDNTPAWTDLDDELLHPKGIVIDFDDRRVILPYNVKLDNSWEKDFTRTRYLGGSITGDWNRGVMRNLTAKTDSILIEDRNVIREMRRLSIYPSLCHVRTPDGSSFAADIEVSESRERGTMAASFSLDIKKVDTEGFEGMSQLEWKELKG